MEAGQEQASGKYCSCIVLLSLILYLFSFFFLILGALIEGGGTFCTVEPSLTACACLQRVGGTLPSSMIYGAHISESHYKPSPFYRVNKRKEFYYGGSIDGKTVGGGNEYYLNM